MLLRPLTGPVFSKIGGELMDSPLSACLIRPFVKRNGIALADYEPGPYRTFNAFFCRKVKDGLRPVDLDPAHLIAPCDGRLSIRTVREGSIVSVKQSCFTVPEMLRDKKLAGRFEGGLCFIFRLCVDDYHRYVYADSGSKSGNRKIKGCFHTVRPVALESYPVFTQNSREYTLIMSDVFGPLVQMEVGAMLVGRICNHEGAGTAVRGAEKGMFLYGGSTVILLVGKDRVQVDEALCGGIDADCEVPVRLGQMIGTARHGGGSESPGTAVGSDPSSNGEDIWY